MGASARESAAPIKRAGKKKAVYDKRVERAEPKRVDWSSDQVAAIGFRLVEIGLLGGWSSFCKSRDGALTIIRLKYEDLDRNCYTADFTEAYEAVEAFQALLTGKVLRALPRWEGNV